MSIPARGQTKVFCVVYTGALYQQPHLYSRVTVSDLPLWTSNTRAYQSMWIFARTLVLAPHGASSPPCPSSEEISVNCTYAEARSSTSAQLWSCSFLVDTTVSRALLPQG